MAGTTHTTPIESLAATMHRAMAERNVTFRSLSRRTGELGIQNGRGLSAGYLTSVRKGNERPSLEAIEAICEALEVDPETIAEYRLAIIRRLFDERPPPLGVGYDQAIANLIAFSSGGRSAAIQEFEQLLEEEAQQRDEQGQPPDEGEEEPGAGEGSP